MSAAAAGFRDAFADLGTEPDPELVRHCTRTNRGMGAELTAALLELANPPTALFTSNDVMTMGAINALAD